MSLNFGELGWVIIAILVAYAAGRLHEKLVRRRSSGDQQQPEAERE